MKRPLFLTALFLAACGDNTVPTPVDMTYDVRVSSLDDDCGDGPLPDDLRTTLDLRLAADGHVQMNGWVPGLLVQPSFLHLFVENGALDVERKDQYGDTYRLNGPLTMEALDLTLDFPAYRSDGSGKACRQRLRLQGTARGFLDAASFDGEYPLKTSYYGILCGTDPVPSEPIGTTVFRVDGRPQGETLDLSLEDSFWFSGPVPDAEGRIDWNGPFQLYGELGFEDVPGTFKGTFKPDGTQATLEFADASLTTGCRYHYEMSGGKQVATLETSGGHYRGVYRSYDRCDPDAKTYAYEGEVELVPWHDGRMAVYESNGSYLVNRDGDSLSASGGSESQGEVVTFTADAAPPYLTFTFDDSIQTADGSWCSYGWEVDAVKRYFPDQAWTPAFLPDPPMTTLPSARKTRSTASFLSRGSLGPLVR